MADFGNFQLLAERPETEARSCRQLTAFCRCPLPPQLLMLRGHEVGASLHAMHPVETLKVDGEDVELAAFAVPEMSLSSARSVMTAHDFILTVRADVMVGLLKPEYDALIRELKVDDETMGEPQGALARAGYPSLERLSGNPEVLLEVLGHYLLHEFVGKLSRGGSRTITYWLDSVIRCEVDGATIRLFGVCYSRG